LTASEPRRARQAALAPPRALGGALAPARLRAVPEDFAVEELLGFAPTGSGAHVLLKVRKRNANTRWVARELAAAGGCRPAEVGYAGLKDRRALAVQWFTVPRPRAALDWLGLRHAEFTVLEATPHHRKLPRGALAGNRFAVRLRTTPGAGAQLAAQLADTLSAIKGRGVPNYFGPQRFGRDGSNLTVRGEWQTLPREARGFVLSAARSAVFNALLAARVGDGSWERLLSGDIAVLDGRGSVFPVDPDDATLAARCRALEAHPTGALWGKGGPPTGGAVLELEGAIARALSESSALCEAAGLRQERRSLRVAVPDLGMSCEPDAVLLEFRLPRGAFATAVLRELLDDASLGVADGD
jgi:tRNA pseudouridine13 synthase